MKTKFLTIVCILSLLLAGATTSFADEPGPVAIGADFVVVRPLCLAMTALGSAIFVVALPISLPARSVKSTGRALVVKPAKATFTRQMGDFDALGD